MSFFTKSRSIHNTASTSSSTSLLLPFTHEKDSHPASKPAQKDYASAFGALASQYGASGYAPTQPSTVHVVLPPHKSAAAGSAPRSSLSNVKQVRAKDLGALQNKYGAIGYGNMTSII